MSYGLIPYDKKSRKFFKNRRRRIIIVIFLITIIAASGIFYVILKDNNNVLENSMQYTDEQLLTVVNIQSPLEPNYIPELADCKGFKVSTMASDSLEAMIDDAESQGMKVKIKSAYISYNEQEKLYDEVLKSFLSNTGYTQVRAEAAAQRIVPLAGHSEAQTGLLVELEFIDDRSRAYIERTCINYGFIQRYPENKTSLTRRDADNTIYRFVGADNAVKMRSYNMCLEEYNIYISEQKSQN